VLVNNKQQSFNSGGMALKITQHSQFYNSLKM